MGSCVIILPKTAAISLPWMGIEPGLPSLPILRSEPRSGDDRVGDQRRFCNVVGGVTSPILANIFLDRLDKFIEGTLLPRYSRGEEKARNPEYYKLCSKAWNLFHAG